MLGQTLIFHQNLMDKKISCEKKFYCYNVLRCHAPLAQLG